MDDLKPKSSSLTYKPEFTTILHERVQASHDAIEIPKEDLVLCKFLWRVEDNIINLLQNPQKIYK